MFDFDPTTLLLGLVFSGVGFVAFRYGRRMELVPPVVIGVALMAYPMFVSGPIWTATVGVGLALCLWLFRD